MRRWEMIRGGHRGNDTVVHKRDKENRKLQQELRAEKEKLNSTIIKYQREMTEMQAVSEHTHTPAQTVTKSFPFLHGSVNQGKCSWKQAANEHQKPASACH